MLYGYFPNYPGFNVFEFKVNGIASGGAATIGPVASWGSYLVEKQNRMTTLAGDLAYTPTWFAFISDPDIADAPLYHAGFF